MHCIYKVQCGVGVIIVNLCLYIYIYMIVMYDNYVHGCDIFIVSISSLPMYTLRKLCHL